MTYYQIEQRCINVFLKKGPFRHLCTPGKLTEIICENEDDYRFCVSMIAIAAVVANVRIITFEIMSNHIHVVLSGTDDDCHRFFDYFKDKLKRYFTKTGRYKNLDGFEPTLIPVDSLDSLRNEIVYTSRNAYMATGAYTPFSYPWGGGNLFFNTFAEKVPAKKYKTLTYREKRAVCHGAGLELPDNYEVDDKGMLLPRSFCDYKFGESLFHDARHYFNMVSKNFEAYSEVARRLGDSIVLTDDELFAAVVQISKAKYGETRPTMLPVKDKIDVARQIRRDYNASEGQIQRMLRLNRSDVSQLFGHS